MAKCKKGTIWDIDLGECRVPTRDEKIEMANWKEAKNAASKFGILTGAPAGAVVANMASKGVKSTKGKILTTLAGALVGGAVGRRRAINKQKKESSPSYENVKSRKITKKKKK
tara:strand:+ start:1965 stop:2303 length:339 start_codon:yes stop_codon:yes gene_type:complete